MNVNQCVTKRVLCFRLSGEAGGVTAAEEGGGTTTVESTMAVAKLHAGW